MGPVELAPRVCVMVGVQARIQPETGSCSQSIEFTGGADRRLFGFHRSVGGMVKAESERDASRGVAARGDGGRI
jgi:hypothetical protein